MIKKICLVHSICEWAYIIWLCFLLHKFKIMTHPDAFFIFSKLWFSGLLGWWGWKGNKWIKMVKKLCLTPYLMNCTSYDYGCWYTCVKWWYVQDFFFFFFFFHIFNLSGFSKFIKKCQKQILRCAPPSSHVCDFSLVCFCKNCFSFPNNLHPATYCND